MKKKTAAIILALCVCVSLAACGGTVDPPKPPDPPVEKATFYLTVWYYDDEQTELLSPVVRPITEGDAYNATEYTDVDIEGYVFKGIEGVVAGIASADINIVVTYKKEQPVEPVIDIPDYVEPSDPEYAVDADTVLAMRRFVNPYLLLTVPFESGYLLSDELKLFAACYSLQKDFELAYDEETESEYYYIAIDTVRDEVIRLFGPLAALSVDYAAKDYVDYMVDVENDIIKTVVGVPDNFVYYYNYAVLRVTAGYELWIIDLGEERYDEVMLAGENPEEYMIPWDEISFEAQYARCYIFTLSFTEQNEMYIASMRERF